MESIRVLVVDRDSLRCTHWINDFARQLPPAEVRCLESLDEVRLMEDELPCDVLLINSACFQVEEVSALLVWKRRTHAGCRAIVLSVAQVSQQSLRFLEDGAWSCVPSRVSSREVAAAVEDASRGEVCLEPRLAGEVLQRIRWLATNVPPMSSPLALQQLTPREREILSLIARRMSNLEIAQELVLEVGTVKNHVHSVLKKLGVGNRYDAVAYGIHASTLIDVVPVGSMEGGRL